MFLKIINHSEAITKRFPRTKCYECKKYLIYKGNNDENFSLSIDVGEQEERVMLLPKKDHTIIIMNNNGKTVDKYSF